MNDAVRFALVNRFEMEVAGHRVRQGEMELGLAKSERFPVIDISGYSGYTETLDDFEPIQFSFDFLGAEYEISPTKDVPLYRSGLSLSADWKLYSGGRISANIKGAEKRLEGVEIDATIERRQIIRSLVDACWELIRARQLVRMEEESMAQAERVFEAAQSRYEKGAISRLERDKADAERERVRLEQIRAQTRLNEATGMVLEEMGIEARADVEVALEDASSVPAPSGTLDHLIETALSQRPEIARAVREIRAKKSDLKSAKSVYYPNVDLKGDYIWTGYDRDDLNESVKDLKQDYWSVFLAVKYNLFEGFSKKNKVVHARAGLSSAMAELEGMKRRVISQVKSAHFAMAGRENEIGPAKRNLKLSERNLEAAIKEFELGAAAVDKVAGYHMAFTDARKQEINARIDLEMARAHLRWAVGESIP